MKLVLCATNILFVAWGTSLLLLGPGLQMSVMTDERASTGWRVYYADNLMNSTLVLAIIVGIDNLLSLFPCGDEDILEMTRHQARCIMLSYIIGTIHMVFMMIPWPAEFTPYGRLCLKFTSWNYVICMFLAQLEP